MPLQSADNARNDIHGSDTDMQAPAFVDQYLAYLLARTSQRISGEFHALVQAQGVSLMEWRIMASLSGRPHLCIGELADIVLAKQPTVTKLVGRMQEAGWVVRIDAPQDKRQSLVSLSRQGEQRVKPLLALAQAHEEAVLSRLSPDQSAQLKDILAILMDDPECSHINPK